MKKIISVSLEVLACFGLATVLFVAWLGIADPVFIPEYVPYVFVVLGAALVAMLSVTAELIPEKKKTGRTWRVYKNNETGNRYFEWKDDRETITLLLDGNELGQPQEGEATT